jgi:hypothetical protein
MLTPHYAFQYFAHDFFNNSHNHIIKRILTLSHTHYTFTIHFFIFFTTFYNILSLFHYF